MERANNDARAQWPHLPEALVATLGGSPGLVAFSAGVEADTKGAGSTRTPGVVVHQV